MKGTLCYIKNHTLYVNKRDSLEQYMELVFPYGVHGGGEFVEVIINDPKCSEFWYEGKRIQEVTLDVIRSLRMNFVPRMHGVFSDWCDYEDLERWITEGFPDYIHQPLEIYKLKLCMWCFEISLEPSVVTLAKLSKGIDYVGSILQNRLNKVTKVNTKNKERVI